MTAQSPTPIERMIALLDQASVRVGSFANMNIRVVRRDEAEAILRDALSSEIGDQMPSPEERATKLKLVDLLENIIQVRGGVHGGFATLNEKANEMSRLAAEALLVLGDIPDVPIGGAHVTHASNIAHVTAGVALGTTCEGMRNIAVQSNDKDCRIAEAPHTPNAEQIVRGLLHAMEMQEKREREEFHIRQEVALGIWNSAKEHAQRWLAEPSSIREPLKMLMFCPRCSKQHIDRADEDHGWTNPPHATHTCQHCGLLWRPSNENTTGVPFIVAEEEKHRERITAAVPSATLEPTVPELIRAAVDDWYAQKLGTMSAMIVIHSLLYPCKPSAQDMEWAKEALAKERR